MDAPSIFSAVAAGDATRVRALLDACPTLIAARNPDAKAHDEMTPLHCAAARGQLDIVKLLVARGAEVYSHPFNSYPAVLSAAWSKQQTVVDYFLREIPDRADGTGGLGVTINLAARMGWLDIVHAHLVRDPLAVHQRGWIGDTPLHWPAHNGYVDIVRLLLDAGADIEADEINWVGGKPLHWAAEHSPATVKFLLDNGAEVDGRNVKADSHLFGFTALIMNATQREDCAEVAELLLAAGADIAAVDARGKSALDHARAKGNARIEAVLTKHLG